MESLIASKHVDIELMSLFLVNTGVISSWIILTINFEHQSRLTVIGIWFSPENMESLETKF
jgi:hypothetical protein